MGAVAGIQAPTALRTPLTGVQIAKQRRREAPQKEGKGAHGGRPDRKGFGRWDESRDDIPAAYRASPTCGVVRNKEERSKQEATMEPDRPAKTPPRLPFAARPVPGPAKHCRVLPIFPVAEKPEPSQMVPRSPRPPASPWRSAP